VKTLGGELGVRGTVAPELVATILAARKIDARGDIEEIIRPDLSVLPDPTRLKNFEDAVSVIIESIQSADKIGINGDYDVDGTTAVAQMVRALRQTNTPHGLFNQGSASHWLSVGFLFGRHGDDSFITQEAHITR
jgi:hypothetical protein